MAAEILLDASTEHDFRHDLESFLYILMYICIRFVGPNGKVAPGKGKALPDFIRDWFSSTSPLSTGSAKWGMMTLPSKFFYSQFLCHFQPYFQVLKPCVNKLRKMFANRKNITHEMMISILKETLNRLPDEDVTEGSQSNVIYRKRRREETRSPSDFLQSKFTKHAVTVGGEESYTRRRHLEEMPTVRDDLSP